MATPPTSQGQAPDGKVGGTPDPEDPADGVESAAPDLVWLGTRIPAHLKRQLAATAVHKDLSQQEVVTRALQAAFAEEEGLERIYKEPDPQAPAAGMLTLECLRLRLCIPPYACGVRITIEGLTIEGPTRYELVPSDSAAGPAAEP